MKPARLLLAQILEREGRNAQAKAVYRRIIESDPAKAAALAGLKRLGG